MPAAFPLSGAQNKSDEAGRREGVVSFGRTGMEAGKCGTEGGGGARNPICGSRFHHNYWNGVPQYEKPQYFYWSSVFSRSVRSA